MLGWLKAYQARAAVLEALADYLSDEMSFWEGEPHPGELRAKDLFCAVIDLEAGRYQLAIDSVESSKKRARVIAGVRR